MTAALIEAAYRFDLSEHEHLRELARAGAAAFGPKSEVAAIAFHHVSAERTHQHTELGRGDERIVSMIGRAAHLLTPHERQTSVRIQPAYASCSSLFGPHGRAMAAFRQDGFEDLAGLVCPTGAQAGIAICAAHTARKVVKPNERRYYGAAALHVASAWRLRHALTRDLAAADAVVRPNGEIVHAEGQLAGRSARARLREVVRRRERSRTRARVSAHDAPGFPALLAGTWSLADRFESDGARFVVAYRVAEEGPAAALGPDARWALSRAIEGVANKVIALELGVSSPTVTRLIARALEVLRLSDVREAMALVRAPPSWILEGDPELCCWQLELQPADLQRLTAAERDVAQRLASGASRVAIAEERGTSVATVDSQIAAMYAKLQVGSRRELLRRVTGLRAS